MGDESLRHDVAWATAAHIVDVLAPLLGEEEEPQAFAEIYVRIKAGLETYCIHEERRRRRMKPSSN